MCLGSRRCLVFVADHEKVAGFSGEQIQQCMLKTGAVLSFVD